MKDSPYIDLLQSEYAESIIQFNFSPLHWIHKSWAHKFNFDPLRQYIQSPQTERYAHKIALQRMGILSLYDFDFSEKSSRIGLLTCVQLEVLAFYIGMLRYTDYLESHQLQLGALKTDYQEEFKHFVRYIAPFLLQESSYQWLYIQEEEIKTPEQISKKNMFLEGSKQLANLLQYESEAIKKRFIYKMPKGSVNMDQTSDISDIEYHTMFRIATKINYLVNDTEEGIFSDKSFQKITINA